jgi:flagellar basal body-associated protein FliL
MADEKTPKAPDTPRPQKMDDGVEPEAEGKKQKKAKKEKKPKEKSPPKDKSSKSGGLIKWILIGIGVIGVEAALAYVVLQKVNAPPKPISEAKSNQAEKVKPNKQRGDKKSKGESNLDEYSFLASINDIVVNPALSQGRQFFVISVVLGLKNEETHKVALAREPILRDRFIQYLAKKTFNWFKNYDNSETIKNEIARIAGEVLDCPDEVRVYFTKYVVQ